MKIVGKIPDQVAIPTKYKFKDLRGKTFHWLRVDYFAGRSKQHSWWVCTCKCGQRTLTPTKQLCRGQTKSCGCWGVEATKRSNTKHGYKWTKTYRIWSGMKTRCLNQHSKDFFRYGGRGIAICRKWMNFEGFLEDMGECPCGMTINRKNNNKSYCKNNCEWSTPKQQARNRRSNKFITVDGKTLTCIEWDEIKGYFPGTTAKRVRKGMSCRDAVYTPINTNLSRPQNTLERTRHG